MDIPQVGVVSKSPGNICHFGAQSLSRQPNILNHATKAIACPSKSYLVSWIGTLDSCYVNCRLLKRSYWCCSRLQGICIYSTKSTRSGCWTRVATQPAAKIVPAGRQTKKKVDIGANHRVQLQVESEVPTDASKKKC